MNFCPGELILKLLAWIGKWNQNLSDKTELVHLQCYHVANVHPSIHGEKQTDRKTQSERQAGVIKSS